MPLPPATLAPARCFPQAPQLGMEFMGFLRAAVQKHAFGTVQTKAYIHGARLLRTRLAAKQSEDCLYLNVRTVSPSVVGDLGAPPAPRRGDGDAGDSSPPSSGPEETPPTSTTQGAGGGAESTAADGGGGAAGAAARLPVLVYIHGGDYHDGAGASRPFYLSNALPIKGDVVLVAFNYRLGLLGHFCHPDLSKEAEAAGRPAVSGNYSILDQASKLPSPKIDGWVRSYVRISFYLGRFSRQRECANYVPGILLGRFSWQRECASVEFRVRAIAYVLLIKLGLTLHP